MNGKKKITSGVLGGILVFASIGFSGCNTTPTNSDKTCSHKFSHYITLAPTCTEKGILESLCNQCGEKEFSEIQPKGHTLINGTCSVCEKQPENNGGGGSTPDTNATTIPENVGWTVDKIYERFFTIFNHSKDEFLDTLRTIYLSDLSITKDGSLRMSVGYRYTNEQEKINVNNTLSLVLPNIREDVQLDRGILSSPDPYIHTIQLYSDWINALGCISIQSTDDEVQSYGFIDAFLFEGHAETAIVKIIVNMQNEVYLVYNDATVIFVGKIPAENETSNKNENSFIYWKNTQGLPYGDYTIYGALDNKATLLTIPLSHKGKVLTTISPNAFKHFSALQSVIIPSNITTVRVGAFPQGTKIFTTHTTIPSGWNKEIVESCAIYLEGTWEMVNGEPKPIQR